MGCSVKTQKFWRGDLKDGAKKVHILDRTVIAIDIGKPMGVSQVVSVTVNLLSLPALHLPLIPSKRRV